MRTATRRLRIHYLATDAARTQCGMRAYRPKGWDSEADTVLGDRIEVTTDKAHATCKRCVRVTSQQ